MVDKKSKNYSPARARMKEVTGDLYQEARDAKAAGKPSRVFHLKLYKRVISKFSISM